MTLKKKTRTIKNGRRKYIQWYSTIIVLFIILIEIECVKSILDKKKINGKNILPLCTFQWDVQYSYKSPTISKFALKISYQNKTIPKKSNSLLKKLKFKYCTILSLTLIINCLCLLCCKRALNRVVIHSIYGSTIDGDKLFRQINIEDNYLALVPLFLWLYCFLILLFILLKKIVHDNV